MKEAMYRERGGVKGSKVVDQLTVTTFTIAGI